MGIIRNNSPTKIRSFTSLIRNPNGTHNSIITQKRFRRFRMTVNPTAIFFSYVSKISVISSYFTPSFSPSLRSLRLCERQLLPYLMELAFPRISDLPCSKITAFKRATVSPRFGFSSASLRVLCGKSALCFFAKSFRR